MRNVVLYMFTTLDGFIAGPNGEFLDYDTSDEEMAFANELFGSADGILFGRATYEGFVSYWDALDPADASIGEADVEFARIFRNMTKVVFSRTLDRVDGNAILIKGNIDAEVSKLKRQPGRNLLLICGPELLSTLVKLGLVDEFRILVRPMVLGRGKALFGDIPERLRLKLASTRVFESGVVAHHYEPVWNP
ncbi:MAG: dihydrofolate reductase family protein [Actinomycetota bacterium]|jgi:dihydrofolate reductase|nr:dihydrofolate reductase family protein [Actinomycetota bacterium]